MELYTIPTIWQTRQSDADLSRNAINKYFKAIRRRIEEYCLNDSPFKGKIEVDESYFRAKELE